MKVKIDTKEKLHVITILEPDLAANMTEQMDKNLMELLTQNVKNVVIDLKDTRSVDYAAAAELLKLQFAFYEQQASFVVCNLQSQVKNFFADEDLLDQLNFTPTVSEAMDIVQMEEMEREMGL